MNVYTQTWQNDSISSAISCRPSALKAATRYLRPSGAMSCLKFSPMASKCPATGHLARRGPSKYMAALDSRRFCRLGIGEESGGENRCRESGQGKKRISTHTHTNVYTSEPWDAEQVERFINKQGEKAAPSSFHQPVHQGTSGECLLAAAQRSQSYPGYALR